jgi:uncharacterized membrane protein
VSYFIQFTLALIYGPYLFFRLNILPCLCKAKGDRFFRFQSRLTRWLHHHQDIALWSNLLFTSTIVLACVVRRSESALRNYESGMISHVVGVTVVSGLMTLTAYMRYLKRGRLCIAVVLTTCALATYAQITRPMPLLAWNITGVCVDLFELNVPYKQRVPVLVPFAVITFLLLLAWCYLRIVTKGDPLALVRWFQYLLLGIIPN